MADLADPRRIPLGALLLGLGGLVPFVALATLPLAPLHPYAAWLGMKSVIAYAAVILSFLGGVRWGVAVGPYGRTSQSRDMAFSVLPSLAGWAALLMPEVPGLCLLLIGFILQSLWDVIAVEEGRLPDWFGRLRMLLTAGAVLALLATLVQLLI